MEEEENNVDINSARETAKTAEDSHSELLIRLDRGAYIVIPVMLAALALWLFRKEKKEQKNRRGTDRRSGGRK